MRLLFVKHNLEWPRSTGQDVHCFHMMQALSSLGHPTFLATVEEPTPAALDGLPLAGRFSIAGMAEPGRLRLSRAQERLRSYYGAREDHIIGVARAAEACHADAVVVVGLEALPYLAEVRGPRRIWYAADEWVWHHLSLVRLRERRSWRHVRYAAIKGLYERSYAPLIDRAWVVSESERRAMQWLAGVPRVDVLPNGVDAEEYCPIASPHIPRSAVFWGRLDFLPNIQALEWFCRNIWPAVRRRVPNARFTIIGFNPTEAVECLAGRDGISLRPNVVDLRREVSQHAVVVLPFVSGGGIKNKLLEAASLGKAIVCTPRACGGLQALADAPLIRPRSREEWATELLRLWTDPALCERAGAAGRAWVMNHHTWLGAARGAVATLA